MAQREVQRDGDPHRVREDVDARVSTMSAELVKIVGESVRGGG